MTNQYPPPNPEPDPSQQQPQDPFGPPPDPAAGAPGPGAAPPPPAGPYASGAAGVPGPGDMPPPPPPGSQEWMPEWQPTKKKSKAGLIIGIVVVVVLLLGGAGGAAWYFKPWENAEASAEGGSEKSQEESKDDGKSDDEGEPSRVAEEAWFAPTWDELKPYLCTGYAAELEDGGAADQWQPASKDEDFEVTGEKISGDSAEVTVKTLVEGGEMKDIPVSLQKEDGDWRICEIGDPQ